MNCRPLITLAVLTILCAGCGTLQQVQQVHTNIDTLHTSFASLLAGQISAGELTLADVHSAKSIYDAHYAATGSLFDKSDSECMGKVADYHPVLMSLFGAPTATVQAAPVTGFFSKVAAGSIAVQDAATNVAAKEAILRKGLPPELEIACAPWFMQFTGARALTHGGVKQ